MPSKIIEIAGIGPVEFTRRRTARSIKLSISGGSVKVSLPFWAPYASAMAFVSSKTDWIQQHMATHTVKQLVAGQAIGKTHRLHFAPGASIGSRITGNAVTVTYPSNYRSDDAAVQAKAKQAAMRALRQEALALLPARVEALASKYGYSYGSISIKHLKRRWGSCDQDRNLTFNLFLMELPWDLIDYVIMHELNHTRHMNHSSEFWTSLQDKVEGLSNIRKRMRTHQPVIGA